MRLLFLLALPLFIFAVSCDGRGRAYLSNKEVLMEHNLLESFSENVSYIPVDYTETITDTILSNGFSVRIKLFTDMENSKLLEYTKDTINYKEFYRETKAEVQVKKDNTILFDRVFNSEVFTEELPSQKEILKVVNLQAVSTEQLESSLTGNISITFSFKRPKENKLWDYRLIIDEQGNHKFEAIYL
ncbi:hypothetical protein [Mangrovimonas aestuarii]|uniref:hypothetical protein n=1 Tax=Mangrovimonas aestuarii TaxID=3018443 RepID=UPI002379F7D6|nr:hypothetical protein [Mangrovimonas aestuarii]